MMQCLLMNYYYYYTTPIIIAHSFILHTISSVTELHAPGFRSFSVTLPESLCFANTLCSVVVTTVIRKTAKDNKKRRKKGFREKRETEGRLGIVLKRDEGKRKYKNDNNNDNKDL